jgi:hypothetical protein
MKLHPLPAALAAFALFGCSEPVRPPPEPAVTVRLSSDNPDSNAAAIADFVRRTCLEASGDPGAFELAVQGSGWDYEKIRSADAANPVNAWRIGEGRLFYSRVEVGPGVRVVDCHVELDSHVAPSVERMRAALRPLLADRSVREARGGAQEVGWQWRPSPDEERALTIAVPAAPRRGGAAAAGRRGIAIHFATTPAVAPEAAAPK